MKTTPKIVLRYTWVLLVLLSSLAAASGFGARSSAISEDKARGVCGYGVAGVLLESIDDSGLAAYLGLKPGDVLISLNGVRTLAPEDLESASRNKEDANTVAFARAGHKWTVTVEPSTSTRIAFVLPPEIVDDPGNAWTKLGASCGIQADYLPTVPSDLSKYRALVLASERAAQPSGVPALREYLQNGGGLVIIGDVPEILCGGDARVRDSQGAHLDSIADWFGVGVMDYNVRPGLPAADLSLIANRPFGSAMRSGDLLFQYVGRRGGVFPWITRLGSTAVPVAAWHWPNMERYSWPDKPAVGAFYNRYGQGRVYWQYDGIEPAYPKEQELLIDAIRWAANAPAGQ